MAKARQDLDTMDRLRESVVGQDAPRNPNGAAGSRIIVNDVEEEEAVLHSYDEGTGAADTEHDLCMCLYPGSFTCDGVTYSWKADEIRKLRQIGRELVLKARRREDDEHKPDPNKSVRTQQQIRRRKHQIPLDTYNPPDSLYTFREKRSFPDRPEIPTAFKLWLFPRPFDQLTHSSSYAEAELAEAKSRADGLEETNLVCHPDINILDSLVNESKAVLTVFPSRFRVSSAFLVGAFLVIL